MKARQIKANFAINVVGALIPIGIALVTVPIYVRHVGVSRYGLLSIVWLLLGYFGFLDLGLSSATANALARLRHSSQDARARVLVTTLILNLFLGLLGSVVFLVFGSYLLQHVFGVQDELKPEIAQAFPWMVGVLPLALLSGVGIGAIESRERFLLANIVQGVGGSLGQIVPVILAVTVGPSLAIIIPAAVLVRAASTAVILVIVVREEGPLSLSQFDRGQARALIHYGGWVTVSSILGPVLTSLDQFVIATLLNVASVAHYAVPMNLVNRSQLFSSALARTLFPRMSSVGREHAVDLASRAFTVLSYAYGSICAAAIVFTPTFFRYWLDADFAAIAAPVAEILFFGAWINGLAFVPYALMQSQGRPDITAKFHAIEVVPFIGILWLFTSVYGVTGAALAWSMRCAADAILLIWTARIPRSVVVRSLVFPLSLLLFSRGVVVFTGSDLWVSLISTLGVGLIGAALSLAMSEDLRRAVLSVGPSALRSIVARRS